MIKITTFAKCGAEFYTLSMSILAKPTAAPKPRSKDAPLIAMSFAVILGVMAVTQLFTFDQFLELLSTFAVPFSGEVTYLMGAVIVVTEIFALPFLFRMPLSKAFRWVSMVCGWLATIIWVKLTLWLVITEPLVNNVGFFGTLVGLLPGWWAVMVAVALAILAGWASWGLWPGKRKK
jgi:hypothetical protein